MLMLMPLGRIVGPGMGVRLFARMWRYFEAPTWGRQCILRTILRAEVCCECIDVNRFSIPHTTVERFL